MIGEDESTLAALAARIEELSRTCDRLSLENAELHRMVAWRPDTAWPKAISAPSETVMPRSADMCSGTDGRMSRRALGKLLGATAAGVVGATAIGGLRASPAGAASGDNVVAGDETTAEARTAVTYDGSSGFGGVVLLGNDSTYGGSSATYPAALGGWAGAGATAGKGGVPNGIYGFTDNGAGNGVVGVNSGLVAGSGSGVQGLAAGAGATGVSGYNSKGTAIAGVSSSLAAEATAIVGTISSTSPGGFSAALRGVNNGTGGLGIGVWGSQEGSGWGLYGTCPGGIGVNGSGGTGVGVSGSGATGVSAEGSETGLSASGPTAVSAAGQGSAGVAVSATAAGDAATIEASNFGNGQAVSATAAGTSAAVRATNTGSGSAVHAEAKSDTEATVRVANLGAGAAVSAMAAGAQPAIEATNSEKGVALSATSSKGRGALFAGSVAQIRLTPATRSTHPVSGERGDLFVDKTGRLWFCKVSGTHAKWVQVA